MQPDVPTVGSPASCPSGTKKFCSNELVNGSQQEKPKSPQATLRLAFGVHHAPKDAPQRIVGQCESAAQALAISIAGANHKLDYVATCIGKSRSYVSLLQSGKRPIPERLIGPLCAATGTNLLRQYVDLHRAMDGISETERLANLLRRAA
ncbi:MAG TPA: hypothetical protein VFP92_10680 [Rhodanobacteraceae bacterium]|nr:hypothetical protein [Rhodanobacteraceae bacterium]